MNKSNWIVPATLVIGILVGGYFASTAGGQIAQAPGYQFPVESLPPHPSQVVNLAALNMHMGGGQKAVIYNVPATHWFVAAAWRLSSNQTSMLESSGSTEKLLITNTQYSHEMRPTGGPTGVAFHPGTQVMLRNDYTGIQQVSYSIAGYLVRR